MAMLVGAAASAVMPAAAQTVVGASLASTAIFTLRHFCWNEPSFPRLDQRDAYYRVKRRANILFILWMAVCSLIVLSTPGEEGHLSSSHYVYAGSMMAFSIVATSKQASCMVAVGLLLIAYLAHEYAIFAALAGVALLFMGVLLSYWSVVLHFYAVLRQVSSLGLAAVALLWYTDAPLAVLACLVLLSVLSSPSVADVLGRILTVILVVSSHLGLAYWMYAGSSSLLSIQFARQMAVLALQLFFPIYAKSKSMKDLAVFIVLSQQETDGRGGAGWFTSIKSWVVQSHANPITVPSLLFTAILCLCRLVAPILIAFVAVQRESMRELGAGIAFSALWTLFEMSTIFWLHWPWRAPHVAVRFALGVPISLQDTQPADVELAIAGKASGECHVIIKVLKGTTCPTDEVAVFNQWSFSSKGERLFSEPLWRAEVPAAAHGEVRIPIGIPIGPCGAFMARYIRAMGQGQRVGDISRSVIAGPHVELLVTEEGKYWSVTSRAAGQMGAPVAAIVKLFEGGNDSVPIAEKPLDDKQPTVRFERPYNDRAYFFRLYLDKGNKFASFVSREPLFGARRVSAFPPSFYFFFKCTF